MKSKFNAKKTKTRKRLYKGGIFTNYDSVFAYPNWQKGEHPWTTLVKIKGTYIYGSSIPSENIYECLATMKFYMYVKDIKRIISLQGCDENDDYYPYNCNGYLIGDTTIDVGYERRVWESLKNMSKLHSDDNYIVFENHKIRDRTAGTFMEWSKIYNNNYMNPNQKTLIHCLAGFGRTGSILLLLYLNDYYSNHDTTKLSEPYLGYNDGFDMISEIWINFWDALEIDKDVNDKNIDNGFHIKYITDELFNTDHLNAINLLITRLNYIRICLCLGFGIETLYLYKIKYEHGITINNMLNDPVLINNTQISDILKDSNNEFGIIMNY
jgi:hypothetical protein